MREIAVILDGVAYHLRTPAPQAEACKWTVSDVVLKWNTSCGTSHFFGVSSMTPQDLGFKYCPYCGRAITEK
jgi:hypothetical protein